MTLLLKDFFPVTYEILTAYYGGWDYIYGNIEDAAKAIAEEVPPNEKIKMYAELILLIPNFPSFRNSVQEEMNYLFKDDQEGKEFFTWLLHNIR